MIKVHLSYQHISASVNLRPRFDDILFSIVFFCVAYIYTCNIFRFMEKMPFYPMTATRSQLQTQQPHLKIQVPHWHHLQLSQTQVYQITITTTIQQVQVIIMVQWSKLHLLCSTIPLHLHRQLQLQLHLYHLLPVSPVISILQAPIVAMLSTIITTITK